MVQRTSAQESSRDLPLNLLSRPAEMLHEFEPEVFPYPVASIFGFLWYKRNSKWFHSEFETHCTGEDRLERPAAETQPAASPCPRVEQERVPSARFLAADLHPLGLLRQEDGLREDSQRGQLEIARRNQSWEQAAANTPSMRGSGALGALPSACFDTQRPRCHAMRSCQCSMPQAAAEGSDTRQP